MKTMKNFFALAGIVLALSLVISPRISGQNAAFRRGDANQDGVLDISDPVLTLEVLFLTGEPPACSDALDANDDGAVDISDPVRSLHYLFLGGDDLPDPFNACGADPTADSLDCQGYPACGIILGQSEFKTVTRGLPPGVNPGPGREGAFDGPAPPVAEDTAQKEVEDRLIEESDIYKLVGNFLYVLNRYRGLQVIDIGNPDRPLLVGRAPIFGYPREMYVRGPNAYVIVSDYYTFWRDAAAESFKLESFHGSQVRIIDISDPGNPAITGGIDVPGDVTDSRIVGDTLYLVSQRYSWYFYLGTDDVLDQTTVLSVDIGDPADVREVDHEDFPRQGWEHHIHVTPQAIYLASSGWTDGLSQYQTRIRTIDIGDPAGTILIRGEAAVIGRVPDRWAMDEFQGVLRVASSQGWGNGDVHLTTIAVDDPDRLRRLGGYTLRIDEALTAARFDGPRGYLVTYRNIDPLFAFDLSDPARPVLLGELEMTGWLDYMVPMGERIVALGHEDLVDSQGRRTIQLAVSLIEVPQSGKPSLLSRSVLDGLWGWVPSERDDFNKVFRVLPEIGLVLFPYQSWSPTDYRYNGGVQLIDLEDRALIRRGVIRDAGWVERGIPHGETTVFTLSPEIFQVVDITDRDHPEVRGRLELARNVQDFALLPGDYTVQLAGDWYRGSFELLTTPIGDPDTPEPTGRIAVPAPFGRLFINGSMAYVAGIVELQDAGGQFIGRETRIQVVDLADPAAPALRGRVALPEEVWLGYRGWYWGSGDEVVQVNGSTLAFHRYRYSLYDCLGCPVREGKPVPAGEGSANRIYLVDLADPDAPEVASAIDLDGAAWAWGLKASGSLLYLSTYRSRQESDFTWITQYFLERIEVADPKQPVVLPEVNIPGLFVDASQDGQYLYTQETVWDETSVASRTFFDALALLDDNAYLQSRVELPGYANGLQVKGEAAFATVQTYEVQTVDGNSIWLSRTALIAIDLGNPQGIRIAGKAEVPFDWAYLQKVEAGRAFLGSGAGIFVYEVGDIDAPAFERFFRTQGWSQDIVVRGDRAFVPSGYFGVQVLDLGTAPAVQP